MYIFFVSYGNYCLSGTRGLYFLTFLLLHHFFGAGILRKECIKTIEFMFAGVNMFWAQLRLSVARAVRRGLK